MLVDVRVSAEVLVEVGVRVSVGVLVAVGVLVSVGIEVSVGVRVLLAVVTEIYATLLIGHMNRRQRIGSVAAVSSLPQASMNSPGGLTRSGLEAKV